MRRCLTAGESHGRALVVIVEGMPSGLLVTAEDIQRGLARRRLGFGRGPRMRFEADEVPLLGGVRHGRTLGSPVAIEIGNTEWPKWEEEMSAGPGLPSKVLTQPRPGHADLSGMLKYGLADARTVLERASARETAARAAAGARATPPCRPCSSTASPTPGTCASGPRPGRPRPGWRRAPWPSCCWPRSVSRCSATSCSSGRGGRR